MPPELERVGSVRGDADTLPACSALVRNQCFLSDGQAAFALGFLICAESMTQHTPKELQMNMYHAFSVGTFNAILLTSS